MKDAAAPAPRVFKRHGRIQAKRLGQGQGLGPGGDVDAAQQLVDGLHGLTVPGLWADPHQRGGQCSSTGRAAA